MSELDLDALLYHFEDSGKCNCGHAPDAVRLIAELRRLREENARLGETVEAFQTASGLCVPAEENGGDPGGVQPRHVEEHVHALAKRVEELETLLGDARYEAETGKCAVCDGSGRVWAGYRAGEGSRYRPCSRKGCDGGTLKVTP